MTDTPRSPAAPRRLRVLMVAFQFPPFAMSSGVQRTLRFVQHLPDLGWEPLVLTAHPRAYSATSADLLSAVPSHTVVERAFALDTARHLAVFGRYPEILARPDRWRTWALAAVPAGLRMVRQFKPDVLWSTYPIATAHAIALRLHRRTGLPWIADFRDPMAQDGYPEDPRTWKAFDRIERATVQEAACSVFVTPSARAMYQRRYGDLPGHRFGLIENGYDEESFVAAESGLERRPLSDTHRTILHSGIVYPAERDPRAFFTALARLRERGLADPRRVRWRFRAPVHADLLNGLARDSGTTDLIEILPAVPYREALQEMMRADALMVMQGRNCNEQIPAKLYEYLRARRPVLGLADPAGDTGRAMLDAGLRHVATLEDDQQVESAIATFLTDLDAGAAPVPALADMSRRARAKALVTLFEQVLAERRTPASA